MENFTIEEKIIVFKNKCKDLINTSGITVTVISYIFNEIAKALEKESQQYQENLIPKVQQKIKEQLKQEEKNNLKKEVGFDEKTGIIVEDVYL